LGGGEAAKGGDTISIKSACGPVRLGFVFGTIICFVFCTIIGGKG